MVGFALLVLAVAACSSGSGDDTNSGSGAMSDGAGSPAKPAPTASGATTAPAAATKTLRDQITDCEAVGTKIGGTQSTEDIVQAIQAGTACYKQAIDGHAAEIDKIRKAAGGMQIEPLSLTTQQAFSAYRATESSQAASPKLGWCEMGHAASHNFGGSLQQIEDSSCENEIEARLAKVIAAETTIPGGPLPLTGGDATKDSLQAFVPKLVQQMSDNTPGDATAYTASVQDTIAAMVSATTQLCAVAEDAGQMAGGSGARTLLDGCVSKALGMVSGELDAWTTSIEDR
jgi:hypothetical protein